jgi:hypothetical protein
MMRTAIDIVEALLHGLRTKDSSAAPLSPDVVLEGAPAAGRLVGTDVARFLSWLSPLVDGIRVERHIVEGPYVATILALDTAAGRVSAFVCFRLSNGLIKGIRPFFGANGGMEA